MTLGVLVCLIVVGAVGGGRAHQAGQDAIQGKTGQAHGTIDVGGLPNRPAVELIVHTDAKKGWNLQVQTEHFRWAPEHVNLAHVPGEGHAHLYVNGKKLTRLYGEWYYLEHLRPGDNRITVTLNANSHDDYAINGEPVFATQIVTVPGK
jgi:hypothetical protein